MWDNTFSIDLAHLNIVHNNLRTGGGVLAEKLGRGVRPASQNPYPIYDQNLRFSLPYLWPNQKFDTLFMTWNIICEGLLLLVACIF